MPDQLALLLPEIATRPLPRPPAVPTVQAGLGVAQVPALVANAGQKAQRRFYEFFVVAIRNPNTREAYGRAATRFGLWCEGRRLRLHDIDAVTVAAYVEDLGQTMSPASVRLQVAALSRLFAWLASGHIVETNPVREVRAPGVQRRAGKSPVLSCDEARRLLDSIDRSHVVGLRDRAIIATMLFSFARVGAVAKLRVRDYARTRDRAWLDLREKGGVFNRVPVHHQLREYLDCYLAAAELGGAGEGGLFRSTRSLTRRLTARTLSEKDILGMVKRRCRDAGLPASICNHSFRATGITLFLDTGGGIDAAAAIAGHASTATTQLYDRRLNRAAKVDLDRITL